MKNKNQEEKVKELFNLKAKNWSDRYSSVMINRKLAFERLLKQYCDSHRKLIDVGCGTGNLLRMASDLGFETTGIDISPEMVKACKDYHSDCCKPVNIICGSFERNVDSLSRFDVILFSSVFEYLDDPELYLELFGKVLNENGILLISIPNTKSLARIIEKEAKKVFHYLPFITRIHPKIINYNKYLNTSRIRISENVFEKKVKQYNFTVEKKNYFGKRFVSERSIFWDSSLIIYVLKKKCNT